LNPPSETAPDLEKSAAEPLWPDEETPRLATVRDRSEPLATTRGAETSRADLEVAIVRALTLGLTDVARALARRLEERWCGPNVIDLGTKRGARESGALRSVARMTRGRTRTRRLPRTLAKCAAL
jgi:hypothetical protein